jgi:hypothetical protein
MDATKRLDQSQKLISPQNLNHIPKDVANNHMRTQLVKLNEITH